MLVLKVKVQEALLLTLRDGGEESSLQVFTQGLLFRGKYFEGLIPTWRRAFLPLKHPLAIRSQLKG